MGNQEETIRGHSGCLHNHRAIYFVHENPSSLPFYKYKMDHYYISSLWQYEGS